MWKKPPYKLYCPRHQERFRPLKKTRGAFSQQNGMYYRLGERYLFICVSCHKEAISKINLEHRRHLINTGVVQARSFFDPPWPTFKKGLKK